MWPFKRKPKPTLVVTEGPTSESLRLQRSLGFPVGNDAACWEHQFKLFADWERRIKALEKALEKAND